MTVGQSRREAVRKETGQQMRRLVTRCVVVGGGPAGMMVGLLLARRGIRVTVLEKHPDFYRDFRGDTIHPATLEVLDELGLADAFLRLPHTKMERVTMDTPSGRLTVADFTKLAGRFGYIAFVPQWDFLNFLAAQAASYPAFELIRPAEVGDLIEHEGEIAGVRATTPDGPIEIRADLVIAADGRHSTVRERAGLEAIAHSPPMDVLWFRLSRRPEDSVPFFRKTDTSVVVSIDRGEYWQLAYVVAPGEFTSLRAAGIDALRRSVASAVPALGDRLGELRDWDDVKLLSVRVDRLTRWHRAGLLCIGDAAHAMSPAGGVGINLAIQDAVASANILAPAFSSGRPSEHVLHRVQRRRQLPVRITQAFQVRALAGLYATEGGGRGKRDPMPFRLLRRIPAMRYAAGWLIGKGVRAEHVREA